MQQEIVKDRHFSRDEQKLSPPDRRKVDTAVERLAENAFHDRSRLHESSLRPRPIKLASGLTPSLFVARAGAKLRLLFAIDDDPLFDRSVLTLFRVVKADEVDRVFEQVANRLYRDFGYGSEENGTAAH